uniref:Ig-like domain-containing protein n=1 Tax=Sinocyclocheilus rhinocerous TaxID=307959 RepID=A0A673IUM9_9TELE
MVSFHFSVLISNIQAPKPRLTVQPEPSQIFRGDTVTLTCDIQGEDWTYTWQCGDEQHNSEEKEFKITAQLKQSCKCKGCRESFCSEWSDAVTLSVSGEGLIKTTHEDTNPVRHGSSDWVLNSLRCSTFSVTIIGSILLSAKFPYGSNMNNIIHVMWLVNPKLTVKPQSSVFTGDTVTLICDEGRSTGRTIYWFKNFQRIKAGSETETLRKVRVSDGGRYACTVEKKTTQSQGVVLTVGGQPKPVVRVKPDGRLFRGGQTVTLTCDIQETDVTSWRYSWNKDDSVINVSQSQEYRISSVSESHTGNYSCTGRETGGSRYSHTSDKVTLTVSGECVYICSHHSDYMSKNSTLFRKAGHRGETIMYSMWKIMCFLNLKPHKHISLHQIHKIMLFLATSYDPFTNMFNV